MVEVIKSLGEGALLMIPGTIVPVDSHIAAIGEQIRRQGS
jgi:hypothetical protein